MDIVKVMREVLLQVYLLENGPNQTQVLKKNCQTIGEYKENPNDENAENLDLFALFFGLFFPCALIAEESDGKNKPDSPSCENLTH